MLQQGYNFLTGRSSIDFVMTSYVKQNDLFLGYHDRQCDSVIVRQADRLKILQFSPEAVQAQPRLKGIRPEVVDNGSKFRPQIRMVPEELSCLPDEMV
jgi:hypothetical protein